MSDFSAIDLSKLIDSTAAHAFDLASGRTGFSPFVIPLRLSEDGAWMARGPVVFGMPGDFDSACSWLAGDACRELDGYLFAYDATTGDGVSSVVLEVFAAEEGFVLAQQYRRTKNGLERVGVLSNAGEAPNRFEGEG